MSGREERDERRRESDEPEERERPLSPGSQIGRLAQTGGTPEGERRPEEAARDPEERARPTDADEGGEA